MFSRITQHDGRKRPAAQTLVLLVCSTVIVYFAYHAIEGRHGLEAQRRLSAQSVALSEEIARLEAVRRRLDHESTLLSSERLDDDLLAEEAYRLGLARPTHRILGAPTAESRAR